MARIHRDRHGRRAAIVAPQLNPFGRRRRAEDQRAGRCEQVGFDQVKAVARTRRQVRDELRLTAGHEPVEFTPRVLSRPARDEVQRAIPNRHPERRRALHSRHDVRGELRAGSRAVCTPHFRSAGGSRSCLEVQRPPKLGRVVQIDARVKRPRVDVGDEPRACLRAITRPKLATLVRRARHKQRQPAQRRESVVVIGQHILAVPKRADHDRSGARAGPVGAPQVVDAATIAPEEQRVPAARTNVQARDRVNGRTRAIDRHHRARRDDLTGARRGAVRAPNRGCATGRLAHEQQPTIHTGKPLRARTRRTWIEIGDQAGRHPIMNKQLRAHRTRLGHEKKLARVHRELTRKRRRRARLQVRDQADRLTIGAIQLTPARTRRRRKVVLPGKRNQRRVGLRRENQVGIQRRRRGRTRHHGTGNRKRDRHGAVLGVGARAKRKRGQHDVRQKTIHGIWRVINRANRFKAS